MTPPTCVDATAPALAPLLAAAAPAGSSEFLGSALVLGREGAGLQVRLADAAGSQVTARSALAFPYVASPGDELLVIGRGGQHFVIGVLAGSGRTELAFRGDVALKSVGGTLELSGDAVKVDGDEITLRARAVRTFADSVQEKAQDIYRWARGRLTVRAGQARRVVEGEDYAQSERSVTLAKDVVKIDGRQVQLGH